MYTKDALDRMDLELENIRRLRLIIAELPNDLPGVVSYGQGRIYIDVGNKTEWKRVRRWFGSDALGTHVFRTYDGHPTWHYVWRGLGLFLAIAGDGVSCHVEQVGTKTVETAVYELICD